MNGSEFTPSAAKTPRPAHLDFSLLLRCHPTTRTYAPMLARPNTTVIYLPSPLQVVRSLRPPRNSWPGRATA